MPDVLKMIGELKVPLITAPDAWLYTWAEKHWLPAGAPGGVEVVVASTSNSTPVVFVNPSVRSDDDTPGTDRLMRRPGPTEAQLPAE